MNKNCLIMRSVPGTARTTLKESNKCLRISANKTEKTCRSDGYVFIHVDEVTPQKILKIWKSHTDKCNILISNKYQNIKTTSDRSLVNSSRLSYLIEFVYPYPYPGSL